MIDDHAGDAGEHERPLVHWSGPADAAGVQRVLIVDDEETLAQYLQLWLERTPYIKASIATSGAEALQRLAEEPYDLLITDYCMPGMNGIALATRVRDLYPRMVIVVLTACDSEELRRQAAELAIHRVLAKPVTLADLRTTILQALLTSHATTVPQAQLSFLVAESDQRVASTLQILLKSDFDCDVVIAADGGDALELCAQRSFQLLVVDYELPGIDGTALAERVRALDPESAVVLLTTSQDENLRARAAGVPVHALLHMPTTVPEIRQAVLSALLGRKGT